MISYDRKGTREGKQAGYYATAKREVTFLERWTSLGRREQELWRPMLEDWQRRVLRDAGVAL